MALGTAMPGPVCAQNTWMQIIMSQLSYLCPTATTSFMMLLDTFLLRKSITVSIATTWSLIGT
jgi:hypothetical protein